MKKILLCILLILLFMDGCSSQNNVNTPATLENENLAAGLVYAKSTNKLPLTSNMNPYIMVFSDEGFFYYVMEAEEDETVYHLYLQPYSDETSKQFCEILGGSIKDLAECNINQEAGLAVLYAEDKLSIREYTASGMTREIVLDEAVGGIESIMKLSALPTGDYVLSQSGTVYFIDSTGLITDTVQVPGTVDKILTTKDNEVFVAVWSDSADGYVLYHIDAQRRSADKLETLPNTIRGTFIFEEGLLIVTDSSAEFFNPRNATEETIIDFSKYSIVGTEIRYVSGNRNQMKIVSMNLADVEDETYLISLTEGNAEEITDKQDKEEQSLYAPDGRRYVFVAIPNECYYDIEYHAKKYNQANDNYYVKIQRVEEPITDYLGKGNRPDVIMFNDHTEMVDFVEMKLLMDLLPYIETHNDYDLDDIIPKAREILGKEGEGIYGVAARFQLLLRDSDGTEYDESGRCDTISYLKWYSDFLTDNEIIGCGHIDELLYVTIKDFIDVDKAETDFTSTEFKGLMRTYKNVVDNHTGAINYRDVQLEKGSKVSALAYGSKWYASYIGRHLTEPGLQIVGLPNMSGESKVYMRLHYPMSVMATSECMETAVDFIMYYNSLEELLMLGSGADSLGKAGNTYAVFSVFEKNLKKEIYESEKPHSFIEDYTEEGKQIYREMFFTEEQNVWLQKLIDSAIPDTKAQRDIYGLWVEEMQPYLYNGKDLDSACQALQNRARLYLEENR